MTHLRTELRQLQARDEATLCRRRKDRIQEVLGSVSTPIVNACACRDRILSDLDTLCSLVVPPPSPEDLERRIRIRNHAMRILECPSKVPRDQLEGFLRAVLDRADCL
jgi:hypothetical protein